MKRSILIVPILVVGFLSACGGGDDGNAVAPIDPVVPMDGVYTGRDGFRMVVTAGDVVSLAGECDDPTGADASWDVWYGQAGRTTPLVVKPPSDPVDFFDGEPQFGNEYHFSTARGESAGEPVERVDRGDPPLEWALHPAALDGSPRTTNLNPGRWDGSFAEDGDFVRVAFVDHDWSDWVGIDASLDGPIYPYWSCSWSGDLETSS